MFKRFKKHEKHFTIALYALLVGILLITFIFAMLNIGRIWSFVSGIIIAMSAFVYGFVIAFLLCPLYKRIHKHVFKFVEKNKPHPKLRKGFSIALTYLIFALILIIIGATIIPQLIDNISTLSSNLSKYINNLKEEIVLLLEKFPQINPDEVMDSIYALLGSQGEEGIISIVLNFIIDNILNIGTELVSQIFFIIVGIILSIYFLIDKDRIKGKLKRLLCAMLRKKHYERVVDYVKYTDKTFGRYIIGTIIDSAMVGIVIALIMLMVGLPYPALIGVICGITNIIPFFGPFIGGIPSGLIVLIATESIWQVVIFGIVILVVQQIDGNLIAPHILGASTGLTPIGVIAAVTLCSHLFGFVGMVAGVPLCAIIAYFFNSFIKEKLRKKNLPIDSSDYVDGNVYEKTKSKRKNDDSEKTDSDISDNTTEQKEPVNQNPLN